MSQSPEDHEDAIRMSPQDEQAVVESRREDESVEPADEGVGAHTDAQDDDRITEN